MNIVSNTGPIIALAKIGKIHLLEDLFGKVQIPPMVEREVFIKLSDEVEELEKAISSFIEVTARPVIAREILITIRAIDAGEKEAIALAYNTGSFLIIDDRQARIAAEKLGLNFTGSIGVLLEAKKKNLIDNVKKHLLAIRDNGYYYSDEIIDVAVKLAGE
ncbi:MAG: DUF3368 domain-containing protein [Leptospiraceae bacterium]|nr:DUF3368 domain-containing protein [Leptospiraceae bacterium]MCP5500121.1 DUF3368 domain-containing protein [Leptospiraceae bacterium]